MSLTFVRWLNAYLILVAGLKGLGKFWLKENFSGNSLRTSSTSVVYSVLRYKDPLILPAISCPVEFNVSE